MMKKKQEYISLSLAGLIILLWCISTWSCFHHELDWASPWTYVLFLVQTHLYTGLFITAHDAMHSVVSRNKILNAWIGKVCTTLFMFNHYPTLFRKHHEHHRYAGTAKDPDYHTGNFWIWYFNFAKQYVSIWQIIFIAVLFNILIQFFPEPNVLIYWAITPIASTFQLFYFGTYLPHRGEHDAENIHNSRSQSRNHWWAFISCYFFGYHYEHHDSPHTPWWGLYQVKDQAKITS